MLPLGILGVFWLMFSPCGTESTCQSDINPLIVEPAGVVEEYGYSLSVNCSSTAEEHEGIYWRVGNEDIPIEEDWNFISHNLSLSDYNMMAQCRIKLNESYECSSDVEITVYKNPEVLFSIKLVDATVEETQYDLQCDVFNVAPVQNLTVKWYKDNETIMTKGFDSPTKTPVNETVIHRVNISRSEREVQLRCEAQLDFGPREVQLPVVSQTDTISALYAPEMKPKNHLNLKIVSEGENVTLHCDAEGNPPPVYSWSCDGVDMLERTDNLTFVPVNLDTTCTCMAANHLGNRTEQHQIVTIRRAESPTITTPKPQTPRACPLTLTPPEIVARFGDPVSADCNTSATDALGMGWESPVQGTGLELPPHVHWSAIKLDYWLIQPFCYITLEDGYQCNVTLPITLYKTPDKVSVSGPDYGLEGKEFELTCDIDNVAPANKLKVSWYKDDQEIRIANFSETSLTPVSVSSTLIINATRDDDGSIFRCEAVLHLGPNGPETMSANHTAVVQYAPEMKPKNHLNLKIVSEGENVTLHCDAEGNPPPVYSWSCDGVDMLERTDNLTFVPVNLDTTCTCMAANHLGNRTEQHQIVTIRRAESPTITTPKPQTPRACPLTLTPPEIVARFGDPVSADCNTSATDALGMGWESPVQGTGLELPPHVHWSAIKLDYWLIQPFCYITLEDGYQCNVTLPITLYKTPDKVSVSGPDYGLEGKEFELTCDIDNVAPANKLKVSWYKDDQEIRIANFSETSLTPVSVSSTLIINATRDDDGSIFRCEAVLHLGPNGPETMSANYTAVVQYKPLFKSCPRRHNILENEFSLDKFPCKFDGNPPPKVQWFYEGEVSDSSKTLRRSDTGNYVMRIANEHGSSNTSVDITVEYGPSIDCDDHYEIEMSTHIQTPCEPKGLPSPTLTWFKDGKERDRWTKNDSGEYVLNATNTHGTANHTLYLDILYAPEINEANETKEVIEGQNVTLHCEAEGNPPPAVSWLFTSTVTPDENAEWRQNTITVTAATSTSAGVYSCIATNRVGKVTRTVSLVIQGKSRGISYVFIWVFLIILIILVFIMLVVYFLKRQKKHGQYSFIPSNIPLSARSTGGNL